jgi:hypothetical protein
MRSRALWLLAAAALAAGCRKREQVQVDTTDAKDIPREIAVSNLRETLPKAEQIRCTQPGDSLKQSEIREWVISGESVVMRRAKGGPLILRYSEVTRAELEKVSDGKYFNVKVYTTQQPNPEKEHFQFTWRSEDTARRAHELIEALRQKR